MILLYVAGGVLLLYLFLIFPNLSRRERVRAFYEKPFAHRGLHDGSQSIPENSMAAFQEALAHGCGIELDVHLTKDKRLVVFHDDSLKRMCGVRRNVEDCTYEELLQCDLAHTAEKIPLFSDVLACVNGRVPLLIELKLPTKNTEVCRHTYEALKTYRGPYMVQSFNSFGIYWFRKHAPHVLRGQLASNLTKSDKKSPYITRFLVKNLLLNFIIKPDFISYKLKDRNNLSFQINRKLFHVPAAAWTLRTKEDYDYAAKHFDMLIFERF